MNISADNIYSPKIRQSAVVRRQISLMSDETVGLYVLNQGKPFVPDDYSLVISREVNLETDNPTWEAVKTYSKADIKATPGLLEINLTPDVSGQVGVLKADWSYTLNGNDFKFTDYYEILEYMPTYDNLADSEKAVIQQVSWLFGDLYDNTVGGEPYFAEEFQTHYTYERMAQLMMMAMNRINMSAQPMTNFRVGPAGPGSGAPFPTAWNGLLVMATYIEVLKHFCRTYVEQPSFASTAGVAMADRRDYLQRWQSIISMEEKQFADMLRMFKRKQMGLGSGALIVSGGIFGGGAGGMFQSGTWAMQTRAMKWYPQSFAIMGTQPSHTAIDSGGNFQ